MFASAHLPTQVHRLRVVNTLLDAGKHCKCSSSNRLQLPTACKAAQASQPAVSGAAAARAASHTDRQMCRSCSWAFCAADTRAHARTQTLQGACCWRIILQPWQQCIRISKHAMHILLPAKHAAAAKPHQLHRHWCATRPSFVPIAVTPCCDQKPMVATAASRTSAQHCAGMPQQHIRSQGPGVISWDQKRPVAKDTACTNVKICSTLYMSE